MCAVENPYKVSIGIPIYGVEKYIERCARSLFEQTYENIEYVFVNDCTRDCSVDILKKVIREYPNRVSQVKILNHAENQGLGAARNTAVDNASGVFLMWVDSDDYVDLKCVEKLVAKQVEADADIVSCDAYYDYGSYKTVCSVKIPDDARKACLDIVACRAEHEVWGRLYRTVLYTGNKIKVKQGCDMGEDRQVVPRLFFYAKKIAVLHEPLYYYYKGNVSAYTSTFSEKKASQWLESIELLEDFFKDKSPEFQHAQQVGAAVMTAQLMAGCARRGSAKTYRLIREKMNEINCSAIKEVSPSYRVFFILRGRLLLKIYAKIGHLWKHKTK